MWLDRLSGHSTLSSSPPPHNRSYSPASRRPSHLAPAAANRPAFSPRSSSLNVSAKFNSSSTSLNSPRLPNGSGLKQQITPPVDYTDPLKVLEDIIGSPIQKDSIDLDSDERGNEAGKPPELVADIEFNGLGLHEFLQLEDQSADTELDYDSAQTDQEYEKDKDKFEELHRSISACDDVLKAVETSLTNFQKDLGTVSAEIETLQLRSSALNTNLENRRVVEKLLGPAVEEIAIAPSTVKKISEGPIDQSWIKALDDLDKRLKNLNDRINGGDKILAVSDIKPLLEDLTDMAIEQIRDFFVSQIKALRLANMNAQIIQQNSFLAYKDLFAFLSLHHEKLAEEIAQAYINTMRWYYLSHFTRYMQALERLPLIVVDKHDALGADQTGQRAIKNGPPNHDTLSLGRRVDILKRTSSSALSSDVAEDFKTPTYLETPFHAFNTALIDNASFEYSFLTAFFPSVSFHVLSQYFNAIFAPTFALGHTLTKQLIDPTYDCLGILLCIRLNQHLAFELQRRKCPVADGYINGTNMLLWPRFQVAMDMHVESVKRATGILSGGARATLSLTSAGIDTKGSTAPHVLTQRFGQFLQSILALSSKETSSSRKGEVATSDIEPVARSLERLRSEVQAFLTKAAKTLPQGRRERFLGNNYSLILTIVSDTGGRLAEDMKEWFEGLRETAGAG